MTPRIALIFANGAVRDGAFVRQILAASGNPLIIAADGGAKMAHDHFGLIPHIILGDLDSLTPDELAVFRELGVTITAYPPEKDETDLEIALKYAVQQPNVEKIHVIGALGRRIDQTFGNVYLLALPELNGVDVRLISNDQQIWMLRPGSHEILGKSGDTVSLIPIHDDVEHIYTDNLYYTLNGETLFFGPARGISNVMMTDRATVRFDSGVLLVVHTLGRAE